MQAPVFARPIDNPSGLATLAAPYVAGVGILALDDASRLGSPSPSAPVRLTIYQDASFGAILGQFLATGRAGNLVTVAVDAGFPDAPIPAGAVVGVAIGAAALAEVHSAILAAVGAITALQGAAGGVSSVAGRTGAVVLSVGDVGGLGSAATHDAADFLAPGGSGALLTGLNASALASGIVAPARLGSGAASASTFLRGDGTWSAPPPAPVTSVAGRTGVVTLSTADVGGLAAVAASGAYDDLSGRPVLATVATTGSYSDLTDRPAPQTDISGQAGTVATIAGRIVAGSNVTISGAGTAASPYSISASGGGSAAPGGTLGSIQYAGPDSSLAGGTLKTNGSTLVTTSSTSLKFSQTGDTYGETYLEILNRDGANGARFGCSLWLVDFMFYAGSTNKQSNLRYNTDSSCLAANLVKGGEFYFYMDVNGSGQLACRIGSGACEWYAPTTFVPTATAGVPLTVKAAPGQSDPLFRAADSVGTPILWIEAAGGLRLARIADAAAGPGCLYFSTTSNKLAFKDDGGLVHTLT